jgi:tetratricopeptide (TPR) repeat protein
VEFFVGNAHLALGDAAQAARSYSTALERHPDHSSAQTGLIWSLLAAGRDEAARSRLREFQSDALDEDRYLLNLADIEYFLGEDDLAATHAREALMEPDGRYWPRGFLAGTILGALLWDRERDTADGHLTSSEEIDRDRFEGGDEGYMPHIDLAAVAATRGDARAACRSLRDALTAGWRYPTLAGRDRLFDKVQGDDEFQSLISVVTAGE